MTGSYVRHALFTAFRVARFDANAVAAFDQSFEGFFRSFFAAAICVPFYLFSVLGERRILADTAANLNRAALPSPPPPGLGTVLFEAGAYVVYWLSMPLAMILIARLIGASRRYVPFIIAYNWGSCLVYAAMMVPSVIYLMGFATLTGVAILYYAGGMFVLIYRWRLARDGLQVSSLNAAGVVIFDVLLSFLIALLAARLRRGL